MGSMTIYLMQFLPTPSARRATAPTFPGATDNLHFYPRPPRGGRLIRGVSTDMI